MKYDPEIHVPARAAANASKGIRYTTDRHGNPRQLIAERGDGVRRFPVLDVYDPDATPKAAYHGPGAFRYVVNRADLEEAERFAVAATILPGHEDAADPPNPWADAARMNLQRIAEASLRIDSAMGRLPVPGTSDETDVETMQMARQALEVAACALEFVETVRRRRLAEERRARKS